MANKKHGATPNSPPSPLRAAFLLYEAGNVVAARAQARVAAKAPGASEGVAEQVWVAKLWPAPLPSPLPSQKAVAQALAARAHAPGSAYAYALLCLAVGALLGLVMFLRS